MENTKHQTPNTSETSNSKLQTSSQSSASYSSGTPNANQRYEDPPSPGLPPSLRSYGGQVGRAGEDENEDERKKHLLRSAATRRVRPYHLANIGNQWYLFAFDLMRQDVRKFVPARMSDLKVTRTRFERPKGFSVDKLLKGSFGVHSGGEPREMTVWFSRSRAQLVREKKWHHSQEIRELGNGELEVTFVLSSFVEIVPWILGWGEHARALSPQELVEEVRRTVAEVEKFYS